MLKFDKSTVTFEKNGVRTEAVQELSLEINEAEFVSIVGPSGCGKSTLMLVAAGLQKLSSGSVRLDGKEITGPGSETAVVFQEPLLLPWRTVASNAAYGLELAGVGKQERLEKAQQYVDMVGLNGFESFHPRQLSGGMQQRVNLARALVCDPRLLLMDEPFAALDALTREQMQAELLRIWSSTNKTTLFITHQIDEAIYLSDRVLVMSARPGRLVRDIAIDLPRPRELSIKQTKDFVEYEREIGSILAPQHSHA